MFQADHALTTSRSRRATARKPRTVSTLDPRDFPEVYALIVEGDCMSPEIASGTPLKFSTVEPYAPGDLVVLWARPEAVRPGDHQAVVKRLVFAPLEAFEGAVIVEMLNPPQWLAYRCSSLWAVHKCLGPLAPHEKRVRMSDAEIRAMVRAERSRATA